MFVKSAGVPLPIPSDVILLAVAAGSANNDFVLWQAFVALLAAMVVGGLVQFGLARGPARRFVYRYGRYAGLPANRLDAAGAVLKRRGPVAIGITILTPGVRAVAVAGCGVAGVALRAFFPGLLFGSAAFLGLHFFLGYAGLALLRGLAGAVSLPLVGGAAAVLLVAAAVLWWLIRRRQLPQERRGQLVAETFVAWHEAACPACLILGASQRLIGAPPTADARQG